MSERNCCPKCGRKLEPSDVDGYKFVCFNCDENFYSFEAVEGPSKTGFKCPSCGQTESFDVYSVVLFGRTNINADGWDYWSEPQRVEFNEGTSMTCCECGYEDDHERFYDGYYD